MSKFIKERYKSFEPYTPGEQPSDSEYIKLNTNESPFPPAPSVLKSLKEVDMERLRLYPDPTGVKLKEELAKMFGVTKENIFLSNGSDDILNFSFMAFNDDDDDLLIPDITYSFYKVIANLHGINYTIVPLKDDMSIDVEQYIGVNKNIVIPNPNAPTGIALSLDEVERIVASNPEHLVLIDEAYVDFGAESAVSLVNKYDNLLVSQTFSKSRSFAGGRLGFAIASPEIIQDLEMIKYSTNPYNVNTLSLILAEAALKADDYYQSNIEEIKRVRAYATAEQEALGFTVLPSQTNFIFAKKDGISGEDIYLELKKRGVLVRHFSDERIKDYNRITVGTKEQMDVLIGKLKDILNGR